MALQQLFEEAVTTSKTLDTKPDNDILLQLYSLYKQSTEGDINIEPPANMFDFVGKAKFDAWTNLKGKTKEEAMQLYIDLVNKLKGKS
ncbi:acyl-CoA-binding protein [Chitinophaga sp. SYP-B3965]|uniref:acyl-CoA-binding protein n=1 Tax=Chitinophaga sp. SYP-B3965 TaxID=2663120 RepID=UPI00129989DD|nr:acyl-CoA-binding protein [Chitinophaga sp. SYP-B3965]MRG44456.1 acyl-CoA-binding protein [Chitinophaga sp. SYP-B3965]